jgi:tetratricopeptide (TPR) repeat protein
MSRRSEENQLRKAAQRGDMNAAYDLGGMLEEDMDLDGAERWYRLSATAGVMDAIADLGLLLLKEARYDEAEPWLRKAAASTDPEPQINQHNAGLLGACLLELGQLDEAEQWLVIAADAGLDFAVKALDRLRNERANPPRGGSGSDVLQTFNVDSIMFYDGSGHRLGASVCTLTRTRLIIDDARGGVSQIQLRDINGVSTPGRMVSPKMLRITAAGVAYDIYCLNKDQKYQLEAWLSKAIRGA